MSGQVYTVISSDDEERETRQWTAMRTMRREIEKQKRAPRFFHIESLVINGPVSITTNRKRQREEEEEREEEQEENGGNEADNEEDDESQGAQQLTPLTVNVVDVSIDPPVNSPMEEPDDDIIYLGTYHLMSNPTSPSYGSLVPWDEYMEYKSRMRLPIK